MTPIEFPAPVGGRPIVVMAEHIELIEGDYYYAGQSTLSLTSNRRVSVGCTPESAAERIRKAAQGDKP
jgi:hypothetical protein